MVKVEIRALWPQQPPPQPRDTHGKERLLCPQKLTWTKGTGCQTPKPLRAGDSG